jgi:cell surface protein SprA
LDFWFSRAQKVLGKANSWILTIGLSIALSFSITNEGHSQTNREPNRLDTLNKRRLLPSFLLWENYNTSPLFPKQNPFQSNNSPFLTPPPYTPNVEVALDSMVRYKLEDQLDSLNKTNSLMYDFEDISKLQELKNRQEYWKNRSRGMNGETPVTGKISRPSLNMDSMFDRFFGNGEIKIIPTGYLNLDFGGIFRRIDNPSIPIRQQRNGGFNFNQQIQMSVNGSIGDKIKVSSNFDSNNTFEFQNPLKLGHTGAPEDIIKSVEVGNVSMPVQNSLIQGAQNLFGVKTQLQFGKLFMTTVASTQRGRRDELILEGGGQGRPFEIPASDYEENRHFFLAHFFRNNYERWLRGLPQILSGVNVTRVEVYIMNRANNTSALRNFAGFIDLGEGQRIFKPNNPNIGQGQPGSPAGNNSNLLFTNLSQNGDFRSSETGSNAIQSVLQLTRGVDFEQVNGAKRLAPNEFTFNSELGYISLNRRLLNDEVLAVSFEYTFNGQVYKVGELAEDYQNRGSNEMIFLKLLRPARINVNFPTWDLMMKNIYNLNVNQVKQEGFQLQVIYRDDKTGLDNPTLLEGQNVKNIPLIRLTGLDNLNPQNDPSPDGNFDFIPGITIDQQKGIIIFPVLEPFGQTLREKFLPNEGILLDRYVFDTLYRTTQADAELVTRLNKYFLKGKAMGGTGSEIILPGLNIAPGSITVLAGNIPLTEGVDFTVDYNIGRVKIINEAILQSGKRISITFEKSDLVSFQTRSLIGNRFDYLFSDKFNVGGTFLYLTERPNLSRIATGNETLRNSMWGLDANFSDESRFLTKLADALPFTETKEKSLIQINGEFAQLIPGTSNRVNGEAASYIDDFETAITPINMGGSAAQTWKIAATPIRDDNPFDRSNQTPDQLGKGFKRAKLAWYNIDNIFYRESGAGVPSNITRDDRKNHYVRSVLPQEIFPKRDRDVLVVPEPLFELAYFPSERGMYNFNPQLTSRGLLPDPRSNFGGITRAITSEVDFDRNNIEYIEFWMLDPFIGGENGRVLDGIFNENNTTGGKLRFNLGDISEDIIKDGRHSFENGLPPDGDKSKTSQTEWGNVTREQFLIPAFDNSPQSRANQDIGLDGLNSAEEAAFFKNRYLDRLTNVNSDVFSKISQDPAEDDFQYYLNEEFDRNNIKILERYKKFNGVEGNTPITTNLNLPYTPAGSNLPDNEDLNNDNTINELENYYEYEIDLRPGNLEVGRNYIVDKLITNKNGDDVTWYLFRIPVRSPDKVQGEINGFKSIRFMRTYLTDFEQPVVLRMANFRLVGSQWRVFQESLFERGFFEIPEPDNSNLTVSVVNIEENSQGSETQSPYVLPPGIMRDRDIMSTVERQLNEQSLKLCVENLQARDAKAVFKNTNQLDLVQFERIKMFLHADSQEALDGELTAFIRFGTDYTDNYYEVEVPLMITPKGTRDPRQIWPLANEIDIAIQEIVGIKVSRDNNRAPFNLPFSQKINQYTVTVVGRPELSLVQGMMIGVRNPGKTGSASKSICIWANELRVTGFTQSSGWAANARINAQIADIATISSSIRHNTFGFGGLETRLSQRSRESATQYDFSANVNVDKLLPKALNVSIPMYFSVENLEISPEFDPLNPDVRIEQALDKFRSSEERKIYKDKVLDQSNRKNIGFANVRKLKNPESEKNRLYDLSNFSFSYAHGSINQSNIQTASYIYETTMGNVAYNFNPKPLTFEPFKNSSIKAPLIKDINFNFAPAIISARTDFDRRFMRTQYRNADLGIEDVDPFFQKSFFINRNYNINWDFTKNLRIEYMGRVLAVVDEPEGDIDSDIKRDSLRQNLRKLGRPTNFNQQIMGNYKIPFEKIKMLDWIQSDARYAASYTWLTGAIGQRDTLGNVIQNTREMSLNGKVDLVKLYNKNKIYRTLNAPKRPTIPGRGAVSAQDTIGTPFTKGLVRLLTMVKDVNFRYTIIEGTFLPGYMENTGVLGLDRSFLNPGLGFILGHQDPNLRFQLANRGIMAPSPDLTALFEQNQAINLQINALAEPIKDFRITLEARKREMGNYREMFRNTGTPGEYESLSPFRTGSYSITTSMLRTAFIGDGQFNRSVLFTRFIENRNIIQSRLNSDNPGGEYGKNDQEVLGLAFLATYTGENASTSKMGLFPKIPLPNWRVDYRGLTQVPGFREYFSSVNITHGYTSTFDVSNFTSSLLYTQGLELYNRIQNIPGATLTNEFGQYVPIFIMNQMILAERFAPLIGVNFLTKDRLNVQMEVNRERVIGLNVFNSQITEQKSIDFGLDIGYTKAGVKIPFKIQGRQEVLKNDLQFRLNARIVDTRQVQRMIEENDRVTNGNLNVQIRPTVGYIINKKLNITIYFDRSINDPRVTTAFRRSSTAFGGQLRFNLSE